MNRLTLGGGEAVLMKCLGLRCVENTLGKEDIYKWHIWTLRKTYDKTDRSNVAGITVL